MALTDRIQVWIDSKANLTGFRQAGTASAELNAQQTGLLGKIKQNGAAIAGWGVAAAAAGALAVKGASLAADNYASLVGEVRNVHRAIGGTVDQASRWVAIADDFGISGQQVATAFARLGKNVQSGAVDISQWGAEVKHAKDGSIDLQATIESIAEAYHNTNDASARSELLLRAFGRSGRDLIPVLEGGKQAIHDMFAEVPDKQIFDSEDLAKAREYKLAMDDLDDSLRELATSLGEEVAPGLSKTARGFADLVRGVGPVIETLGKVPGVASAISSESGWADEFFRGVEEHTGRTTGLMSSMAGAFGRGTTAVRNLQHALDQYVNSTLGVEGANLNAEQALQSYNEALTTTGADSLETRQAQLNLEQSYIRVADAVATAGGNTKDQVAALEFLRGTVAPGSALDTFLQGYIDKLNGIPPKKTTTVALDIAQAQADAQAFIAWLETLNPVIKAQVQAQAVGDVAAVILSGGGSSG